MSIRPSKRRRLRGERGPARPRRRTAKASTIVAVGFALLPWVSIGFLTPIAFVFAAVRRRSWLLGLAAAGYFVAVLGMVTLSDSDPRYGWCIVAALPIGGIHAAIIAPSVARTVGSEQQVDPLSALADATRDDVAADPVLKAILERRERRRIAREIVARDPALADELCIGQPGRDDRFDDGGLIDVNRVDVAVLATLPGFDRNMATRGSSRRAIDSRDSAAPPISSWTPTCRQTWPTTSPIVCSFAR